MKLVKKLNILSISNNELKVSVCKTKIYYSDSAVELADAESFFMELQVCQFEALGKDMTKQNKQHVKGHVWTFLGQIAG